MAEEKDVNVQAVAKTLQGMLGKIIQDAKSEANAPFKSPLVDAEHKYRDYVIQPKDGKESQKIFTVMSTGTLLDKLFLDDGGTPLNGIPVEGQYGLIGLPDSGKSILMQEVVLRVAQRRKVVLVTSEDLWESETDRADLQSRMRKRIEALNLDWNVIRKNLLVIDTVKFTELRDWKTFIETYRYIVENFGLDFLVVDSITWMDSYRGALKNRLMELCRYNQLKGITAFYVTQRGSDSYDGYSIAGGIGLAHNLDVNICLDVGKASGNLKDEINAFRTKEEQLKQWTEVRFIRVLGCRLCAFDRRHYEVEVTQDGFLKALHLGEN